MQCSVGAVHTHAIYGLFCVVSPPCQVEVLLVDPKAATKAERKRAKEVMQQAIFEFSGTPQVILPPLPPAPPRGLHPSARDHRACCMHRRRRGASRSPTRRSR